MIPNEEPLDINAVQLADTRPNMLWIPYLGYVPIMLGVFILGANLICFVTFGWKFGLWGPIVWFGAGKLISKDYNAIKKSELYMNTSAWNKPSDTKNNGGVSVTTFPVSQKYNVEREII